MENKSINDPILDNLARVQKNVQEACTRVGRDPASVRILPVSKTVPTERLRVLLEKGVFQELGENRVQEIREKRSLPARFVLIGHLQLNKVKYLPGLIWEFQALDSLILAEALDRRFSAAGLMLPVWIQVNTSGETSKFGLDPSEVLTFVRHLSAYSALQVRGLMTLAVFSNDEAQVRACFRRLRALQEQLRQDGPSGMCFDGLSMGMSSDYVWAIEEGATCIRLGTALFGARSTTHTVYWNESEGSAKI